MTILLITALGVRSDYGGGQVYVQNLIDELDRQKASFYIASPADNVGNTTEYRRHKVFNFSRSLDLSEAVSLLKNIHPDIVHAHGFKAIFSIACRSLNIPCIITAHHGGILCPAGTLLNHRDEICKIKASHKDCLPCVLKNIRGGYYAWPILRLLPVKFRINMGRLTQKLPFILYFTPLTTASLSIQKKLEEWDNICKYSTLVIAPSNGIAESMLRNGLPDKKLKLLPHGIPLPELKPEKSLNNDSSQGATIKFFYTGRICHVKGIHILLEAFSFVRKNAELHLIGGAGNRSEERYMKRLQRKYRHDNRIFWHGKVEYSKIYEVISKYDIMVHPAICLEAFGLNIAEALALGKPVIATRCGGPEMQIVNGINGYLVNPNNVEELGNIMLKFGSEYNKDNILGINTKAQIVNIESHTKEVLYVYKKLTSSIG